MTTTDNTTLVRRSYEAFSTGDRDLIESLLATDGFSFHAPPDPELDRDGYFERCWPGAGNGNRFDLVRTIEQGDEVVVTYVAERPDGTRFRNTEVFTVADGAIRTIEVYFGWDL